jgi:hypothetical protein
MDLTLEALLSCISLVRGDHLDETEATRLLCVRVAHNVTLLDLAILLEETGDLLLGERGMDASDEEVGARVAAAWVVVILVALSWRRATALY